MVSSAERSFRHLVSDINDAEQVLRIAAWIRSRSVDVRTVPGGGRGIFLPSPIRTLCPAVANHIAATSQGQTTSTARYVVRWPAEPIGHRKGRASVCRSKSETLPNRFQKCRLKAAETRAERSEGKGSFALLCALPAV